MKPFPRRYLILISIILLAFFLRVWRLPQTPPGLWYDEAYYSMDAAWLLDGGPWRLFFVGNNGREPIFIYLQAAFIWMFGAAPLTSRLLGALLGVLTIPLMYVLGHRLAQNIGRLQEWVSYLATLGLTISFWHLGLSRSGYRGILLPLVATLLFYLFWRGWQEKSTRFMVLAGLALGVSQYTYLAARTLPLVFGGFALRWSVTLWRGGRQSAGASLGGLWQTVGIMALVSAVVFAPLGWIFYNNPALFSARTGDVLFTPDTITELFTHLLQAIRLFIDGGDPNWRHHLPGRPMLGWLGWLGFWPGLWFCLRRYRSAPHLFLATALAALYLPALLAVPPVHALRLSALLPVYYLIFALGLVALGRWLGQRWLNQPRQIAGVATPVAVALVVLMLAETGLTAFDYFYRWAPHEKTYVEYNAPLVDFVEYIDDLTDQMPVIVPFQIYVHPTARYLLHDSFTEVSAPDNLAGPVQLVNIPDNFRMLNVANIPELPAFAWLARDADGRGVVYISRPPRYAEQNYLQHEILTPSPKIFQDRFGRDLAHFRLLDNPDPLLPMFTHTKPLRTINLQWPNLARLQGYEVTPTLLQPNQSLTLNLYWQSLTNMALEHRLFLQLVDSSGNPINQLEDNAFSEDMYRWRPGKILPTQHTLWLGPDTPPGPYLIRLGFFNPDTQERLPLIIGDCAQGNCASGESGEVVDQVHLGLFYVSPNGSDPRQPATPLSATFAGSIQLTGVTLPNLQSKIQNPKSQMAVTFHWQSLQPTDKPYTVFLQLLDQNGSVISSWDSQPLGGLYPTSRWSPGEVITDTFLLPLPQDGLPPGSYRLITGFYNVETSQRLPVAGGSDFAELANFKVD